LATLFGGTGDFAKAEPLLQEALRIDQKVRGSEHPHTALILNNLARLYYSRGQDIQAESLYQRALAIQEQALGQDHADVAGMKRMSSMPLLEFMAMGDEEVSQNSLSRTGPQSIPTESGIYS